MKKYAHRNAILSIPVSAIFIIVGAWVFITSSDKSNANGYFLAGLGVGFFGIIWYLIDRKWNNQKVSYTRKIIHWRAILSIPVSAIFVIIGAWVFITSSDKSQANGYFLAGLGIAFFGIIWYVIDRKWNNQKVSK
jgi:uncharacterized sodium:solute symporter family permease YidK